MEVTKDVYEYMTNFADDKTILNMLSVNRKFNDPIFFERVMMRKYPLLIEFKKENESWKEFFIRMVYAIAKLEEETKIPYIPTKGYNPDELYQRYKNSYAYQKLPKSHVIYVELGGEAAKGGHLSLLNLVLEKYPYRVVLYNRAIIQAAAGGQFNLVKYLAEKAPNSYFREAFEVAAKNGHLNIIEYLLTKFQPTTHDLNVAMNWAAERGHLEIVKYLVGKGARSFSSALEYSASSGHMDIVKYLVSKSDENLRYAIYAADRRNHGEIVNYLTDYAIEHNRY